MGNFFALQLPQPMFGADAAVQLRDNAVYDAVHLRFGVRNKIGVAGRIWQRGIVVNIAIAEMAESDYPYRRESSM